MPVQGSCLAKNRERELDRYLTETCDHCLTCFLFDYVNSTSENQGYPDIPNDINASYFFCVLTGINQMIKRFITSYLISFSPLPKH
jgi:hypothetical protein